MDIELPQIPGGPLRAGHGAISAEQFTRKKLKGVLHAITGELKQRGTKTPHVFLPFRSKVDDTRLEQFLRELFPGGRVISDNDALHKIVASKDEFTLICAMKYMWSRLPNNEIIGWNVYLEYKRREKEAGYPKQAFLSIMPKCLLSPAHASIVYDFLDLLISLTSNSQYNYLSGRKISKMASMWAFNGVAKLRKSPFYDATLSKELSFSEGLDAWKSCSHALFHLLLSFLRAMLPENELDTLKLPKTLQSLLITNLYPPQEHAELLKSVITIPCVLVRSTRRSENPYELLSKVRHTLRFDKKDSFLSTENYTILKNIFQKNSTNEIIATLTEELRRVLNRLTADPIQSAFDLYPGWTRHSDEEQDPDIPLFLAISITNVSLQDYYIWTWLLSLASDQPAPLKNLFGRSLVVEAGLKGLQKWLIVTEQTMSAETYLATFSVSGPHDTDKLRLTTRLASEQKEKPLPPPALPPKDDELLPNIKFTSEDASLQLDVDDNTGHVTDYQKYLGGLDDLASERSRGSHSNASRKPPPKLGRNQDKGQDRRSQGFEENSGYHHPEYQDSPGYHHPEYQGHHELPHNNQHSGHNERGLQLDAVPDHPLPAVPHTRQGFSSSPEHPHAPSHEHSYPSHGTVPNPNSVPRVPAELPVNAGKYSTPTMGPTGYHEPFDSYLPAKETARAEEPFENYNVGTGQEEQKQGAQLAGYGLAPVYAMGTKSPPTHQQVPPTHQQVPPTHQQVPPTHQQVPPTHQQVPPTHQQVPPTHQQVPPTHQQVPPTHQQVPPTHQQVPTTQGGVPWVPLTQPLQDPSLPLPASADGSPVMSPAVAEEAPSPEDEEARRLKEEKRRRRHEKKKQQERETRRMEEELAEAARAAGFGDDLQLDGMSPAIPPPPIFFPLESPKKKKKRKDKHKLGDNTPSPLRSPVQQNAIPVPANLAPGAAPGMELGAAPVGAPEFQAPRTVPEFQTPELQSAQGSYFPPAPEPQTAPGLHVLPTHAPQNAPESYFPPAPAPLAAPAPLTAPGLHVLPAPEPLSTPLPARESLPAPLPASASGPRVLAHGLSSPVPSATQNISHLVPNLAALAPGLPEPLKYVYSPKSPHKSPREIDPQARTQHKMSSKPHKGSSPPHPYPGQSEHHSAMPTGHTGAQQSPSDIHQVQQQFSQVSLTQTAGSHPQQTYQHRSHKQAPTHESQSKMYAGVDNGSRLLSPAYNEPPPSPEKSPKQHASALAIPGASQTSKVKSAPQPTHRKSPRPLPEEFRQHVHPSANVKSSLANQKQYKKQPNAQPHPAQPPAQSHPVQPPAQPQANTQPYLQAEHQAQRGHSQPQVGNSQPQAGHLQPQGHSQHLQSGSQPHLPAGPQPHLQTGYAAQHPPAGPDNAAPHAPVPPQGYPHAPPTASRPGNGPYAQPGYPPPQGYYPPPQGYYPPPQGYYPPPQGYYPPPQGYYPPPPQAYPYGAPRSKPSTADVALRGLPEGHRHNKNKTTNKADLRAAFNQGSFGI